MYPKISGSSGIYRNSLNLKQRSTVSLPSMNFRLWRFVAAGEKIEIASLMSLRNSLAVESPVPSPIVRGRLSPCSAPCRNLCFADQEIQSSIVNIKRDEVIISHECERPTNIAFRRHVKNA